MFVDCWSSIYNHYVGTEPWANRSTANGFMSSTVSDRQDHMWQCELLGIVILSLGRQRLQDWFFRWIAMQSFISSCQEVRLLNHSLGSCDHGGSVWEVSASLNWSFSKIYRHPRKTRPGPYTWIGGILFNYKTQGFIFKSKYAFFTQTSNFFVYGIFFKKRSSNNKWALYSIIKCPGLSIY